MTKQQLLAELRKEFAINERLAKLLREFVKAEADDLLRRGYKTDSHADLLSIRSEAQGIERFLQLITEPPRPPAR